MNAPIAIPSPLRPRRRQRGISLLFALLTLAAMSLAAVALLRSVDTTALLVGNLGFKQDSVAYSAQAAEAAIDWLDGKKGSSGVYGKDELNGYYATSTDNLDPTNSRPDLLTRAVVDWDGSGNCSTGYASGTWATCLRSVASVSDTRGNETRYVITRLCSAEGSPTDASNYCARAVAANTNQGVGRGNVDYQDPRKVSQILSGPYYRIIVRTKGPRNTVSYAETLVHF